MSELYDAYEQFQGSVPQSVLAAIIPLSPEISMLTDSELISKAAPDAIDWELRMRLGRRFSEMVTGDKALVELDFYQGICGRQAYQMRMSDKYKSAFIARPLHTFKQATDNLLTAITSRFYELVAIPITTGKGKKKVIDHKSAKLMLDISRILLDRKHGSAIQRQMTLSATIPDIPNPNDVEEKIKALEAEFKNVEGPKKISGSAGRTEKTEGVTTLPSE